MWTNLVYIQFGHLLILHKKIFCYYIKWFIEKKHIAENHGQTDREQGPSQELILLGVGCGGILLNKQLSPLAF